VPADSDGLHQTSLWTLEDDFEGVSTQAGQPSKQAPAEEELPAADKPEAFDERRGQPEGEIAFDGSRTYSYMGYVLEGGAYVRKSARFTCDELDIYPSEPLWRVCASVDAVGRDAGRQAEIKRYGRRAWHSPYRQQDAPMQGLDWVFRHDVDLVAACYPYVTGFYAADAASADRWTRAMYDAYKAFALHKERAALLRLLAEAEIPASLMGLDPDEQEEV
jgi:hypothetical protein